jgi:hypothetical protein
MKTLSDAKDIRARLLKRVQVEQPDAVEEQVILIKYNINEYIRFYKHNIYSSINSFLQFIISS